MSWMSGFFLIIGFIGGIITAVAGGAQFLIFPMLNIVGGLPARVANGTSSMSVWLSPLVSALLLGKNDSLRRRTIITLVILSIAGSCLGVIIVTNLSDAQFSRLVPFLLLVAASALTWGQKIRAYFNKPILPADSRWLYAIQFVLALYAGVYGGGVAIMMLAVYGFFSFKSVQASQQLKNVLAGVMNCATALSFAYAGLVSWHFAIPLMAGNIAGGIVGAHLIKSLNPAAIKMAVIVFAWLITVYYFTKLFI